LHQRTINNLHPPQSAIPINSTITHSRVLTMAVKPPATRLLTGHTGPVFTLGWSVDGRKLASGSKDEGIRIWNPERADYQMGRLPPN